MEFKRQNYLFAIESWPYMGGGVAFCLFVGCAIVLPLQRKLFFEMFGCIGAGMAIAYSYPYYYWKIYMQDVNKLYFSLRRA